MIGRHAELTCLHRSARLGMLVSRIVRSFETPMNNSIDYLEKCVHYISCSPFFIVATAIQMIPD